MGAKGVERDRWAFLPPDGIDQVVVGRNEFRDFQAVVAELFLCDLFHSLLEIIGKGRGEDKGVDANPHFLSLVAVCEFLFSLFRFFAQVLNDRGYLLLSLFHQGPQRRIQLHVGLVPISGVGPKQRVVASDNGRTGRPTETGKELPSHVSSRCVFAQMRIVRRDNITIQRQFFHFFAKGIQLGNRCHRFRHSDGFVVWIRSYSDAAARSPARNAACRRQGWRRHCRCLEPKMVGGMGTERSGQWR
mmetsp:Transcript_48406/g.100146  ORF Transcript_48406/g.100146 Transcript_48406/m.100146 type:complete len:245 (+) Transcript_48406:1388-2122(+)